MLEQLNALDPDVFKQLVRKAKCNVEGRPCSVDLPTNGEVKTCYLELCHRLVDFRRVHGTEWVGAVPKSFLHQLEGARQQLFLDALQEDDVPVEQPPVDSLYDFPSIVDVDWRLDYQFMSDTTGKMRTAEYIVQVKVLDANQQEHLKRFRCSVEELRDLVSKLEHVVQE